MFCKKESENQDMRCNLKRKGPEQQQLLKKLKEETRKKVKHLHHHHHHQDPKDSQHEAQQQLLYCMAHPQYPAQPSGCLHSPNSPTEVSVYDNSFQKEEEDTFNLNDSHFSHTTSTGIRRRFPNNNDEHSQWSSNPNTTIPITPVGKCNKVLSTICLLLSMMALIKFIIGY